MPTDRLTHTTDGLIDRVEALIPQAADLHESRTPDDSDLGQAVETYRAAGRAALQRRAEQEWFHAHVTPSNWATAETAFATHVAPRLDQLADEGTRWWFLRKHPHWRIRIRTRDHSAATHALKELVSAGVITRWQVGIYEPETAAFGGLTGMAAIHDLFCADSRGVLTYARQGTPALGRRELSLLLLRAMHQHAGLDWFEAGDVFAKVADMRPIPAEADTTRINMLADRMRPLLSVNVDADFEPFTETGMAAFALPWHKAFSEAGRQLGYAAHAGLLDRGLRGVLAQIVIFHWNRLGLPAPAQSILAHAARTAILPNQR
jgi:thiopeptide-type bacteriocin biosynthesis protein